MYIKKRTENNFYKQRELPFFDLSYPTTNRLVENKLNLIDKHIWGYSTNRLEKLTKMSESSIEKNNNYYSKKFDNNLYKLLENTNNNVIPLYFTNRTHNIMTEINNFIGNGIIGVPTIINKNLPKEYNIYGYTNFKNMGFNLNMSSDYIFENNLKNFLDILKNSQFILKKKKANETFLGNFNNQNKNTGISGEILNIYLKKNNNFNIKNKNNLFNIFFKKSSINIFQKIKENSNGIWDLGLKKIENYNIRNLFELIESLHFKKYNKLIDVFLSKKSGELNINFKSENYNNFLNYNNLILEIDVLDENLDVAIINENFEINN